MILTGPEIQKQIEQGRIRISPYESLNITTNSYDLRLGKKYLRYTSEILDTRKRCDYELLDIPTSGLFLNKGDFVLAETNEFIGSDFFVPLIHAKSGIARAGLFVHVTADLIDIGSFGKSTLQLFATLPVLLYSGMKIAQVTFWQPYGEIKLYDGKYQNSDEPRPSMIYRDFEDDEK